MKPYNISVNNFQTEVLESDKPVLLDFYATWCGPCRMVGPVLDQIAQEREDIKVCKVNVDEEPALAARYGIITIPTIMVIENGQIKNQTKGAQTKAKLLAML